MYIADTEYLLAVHVRGAFDNGFARDVIVFGVDNSSLSHSDNHKNNFLILGEGYSYGINGSFGSPEKEFSIKCTKANTKCYITKKFALYC